MPSIVVISSAWCMAANVRQELIRRPLICTVQAPQMTVIAALLRSGQVQGLPQTVKQSRAWVNLHPMFLSIYPQRDRNYSSHLHWCLCLLLLDLGLCEAEQGTRGCSSASSSKPRQERATAQVPKRGRFFWLSVSFAYF